MPKVGKDEYGYDKKGRDAAAAESARTGKPVVSKKKKKKKKSKNPVMDRIKKGKGKAASGPAAGAAAMPAPPLLAGGLGSAGSAGALGSAGAGLGGVGPAMEPMPRKKPRMGYKEGGVVYSDARGAGAATRGTRYRS